MKTQNTAKTSTIITFIVILAILILGMCVDTTQSYRQQTKQSDQRMEDLQLVYNREVDLCMCGAEILSNYTKVMERKGVDTLRCCKQKTTVCINRQSMSDIHRAAELIRKDLYSKHIGKANCQEGQETRWKCTFPLDFCLTTKVLPGEITIKD